MINMPTTSKKFETFNQLNNNKSPKLLHHDSKQDDTSMGFKILGKNTLPDGKNKFTLSDGSSYEGTWINRKKEGLFIFTYNNVTYSQEWKNDKLINGYDIRKLNNNDTYQGMYQNEQAHGQGTYITHDGKIYEGVWKNGKRNGSFIFTYNNAKYQQEWKDDKLINGYNVQKYDDGDIYQGMCQDEQAHGQGTHIMPDGRTYQGVWEKHKKNGEFIFTYDGNTYEQQWKNDKLINGYDVRKFSNGDIYQVTYKNGKQHGKGTEILNDGRIYEGTWENDKKNGTFSFTYENITYQQDWSDDKLTGYDVRKFNNGDIYQGTYQNGGRHGKGKEILNNGSTHEGMWENGKKNGTFSFTYKNTRCEQEWKEDELINGPDTKIYLNGDIYLGQIINENPCGVGKKILNDGRTYEGTWIDSKKHGDFIFTYNNNTYEQKWEDDALINGYNVINDTYGNSYEGVTRNGLQNGKGKQISAHGQIYEGTWKNGKKMVILYLDTT